MPKSKIYLGYKTGKMELFRSASEPTRESHGHLFPAVIGPFRTARGAKFMRDFGQGNPHCRCVAEAETIAARWAKREKEAHAKA